jgi:tRNA pseudouridine55 synthase
VVRDALVASGVDVVDIGACGTEGVYFATFHHRLDGHPARNGPARVTAHTVRIVGMDGDLVTLQVECSAGFYVRSLAHDLGERLGVGAHLAGLRRTRTGMTNA